MFCPKCGGQNPDQGKYCRSCGTDLGNVSQALAGVPVAPRPMLDHKGRPVSWDRAIVKVFSGLAFVAVSIALAFSIGRGWWFWMLIPAFGSLGSGIAQLVQLRQAKRDTPAYSPTISQVAAPAQNTPLPPSTSTDWVAPDSRYKTGDLVPPSVTENTTRHLEMDSEGKTMALPKE